MNPTPAATHASASHLFATTIIKSWALHIRRFNDLLASLSDEELMKEIAPGRNSGIYLLGHLVSVHDAMLPLLGFAERFYPALEEPFVKNPYRPGSALASPQELRQQWNHVNAVLSTHLTELPADNWLHRHNAVSPEDFAKEPHRNKANVLMTRLAHLTYHHGQLSLLKRKNSHLD